MAEQYDVAVIGGGAGGLVAAREARRRGARVALVQDGPVGGDCTFTGCVPSKALLTAAAERVGFDDAMARVRRAVQRVAATEDAAALGREGIDVVAGWGRFTTPTTVEVDGRTVRSPRWVVATGAGPVVPPIPGLAEVSPLTSETVFDLVRRPATLTVLGAGAIGCELAQAFARLGTAVTLVEALPRVLASEEPETSQVVARALRADGVDVRTDATATAVTGAGDGTIRLELADGTTVVGEQLLVAVGRQPSGRGFGLEEVGVEVDDRGAVVVDDTQATSVAGIWAVGDVAGGLQLTHAAGRMAWVAVANALAGRFRLRRSRFDPSTVPWAVFTSPEVGRVGLTEAQAADAHPDARVAHLPLARLDRAVATGAEDGFVRLIAAPRRGVGNLGGGRLVGATVVAPTGGDVVHEAALAMQADVFVGRLAQTSHAYPTWSMGIQQAALQFFGQGGDLEARPARR